MIDTKPDLYSLFIYLLYLVAMIIDHAYVSNLKFILVFHENFYHVCLLSSLEDCEHFLEAVLILLYLALSADGADDS